MELKQLRIGDVFLLEFWSNGQNEIHGKVFTIVPRGDIATRTFPVKIRTPNTYSLIEGMSAKVVLPTGRPKESLIVPRDSVISLFGQNVVFTVADSKAAMLPVKVIGYEGLSAGVEARGLQEGMQVVVQGNERLRNGQVVVVKNSELPVVIIISFSQRITIAIVDHLRN